MIARETLDTLYHQLSTAWEAHQHLRRADAPLADLAESSTRLYRARMAMWDWRHCHRLS